MPERVPGVRLRKGTSIRPCKCSQVLDDARATAGKSHAGGIGRLGEIELCVGIPEARAHWGQLVKQPSLELPRLDLVLLARELVDHRDAHAGVTDPVTQLRGEIPLDLLPA